MVDFIKKENPAAGPAGSGQASGTETVAAVGAFAVALSEAQTGVEERAQKVSHVRNYLIEEILRLLPDAVFHGPIPQGDAFGSPLKASPFSLARVANNLSVSVPNLDGQMAAIAMDAAGVAVGTRAACDSGQEEPSHVLLALGVPRELAKGAIRISILPTATKGDARLADAAKLYRLR